MSVCNSCQKTKTLPVGTKEIAVGKIEPSTDVFVYIKNHTTNRLSLICDGLDVNSDPLPFTSTSEGNLTIDVSDFKFMPDHSYELYVVDTTYIRMPVTIGTTEYDCLALSFENYFIGEVNQEFESRTLEIQ